MWPPAFYLLPCHEHKIVIKTNIGVMHMETLRIGSRGPSVELVQLALTRAGFNPGEIDGVFGPKTHLAVIDYQKSRGLEPDGIVGVNTKMRLLSYIRGYITVRVQKGDTFWKLAQMYNTTVEAIQTANPDADPLTLITGSMLVIPFGFSLITGQVTFTYALLELVVDGLLARYPFMRAGSIGTSVMGKQIYYLSMGQGATVVAYNASHHANEWITTPVVLKFIEDYAQTYATGGRLCGSAAWELYNAVKLYVVPMVNPDGVDLVTGALTSGEHYNMAKGYAGNYPNIPFPSGWKANINGVDLNLQYPAGWEEAKKIKFSKGYTLPGPRDYVGGGPLEQPESLAMYQFTINYRPKLTLSYHTQGEVIYWRFLDYEPDGAQAIGEALSAASGYTLSNTPYESGFAGYKDWYIQDFNRPGYTIECGRGENPLPLSQFDKIYTDNRCVMALGMSLIL